MNTVVNGSRERVDLSGDKLYLNTIVSCMIYWRQIICGHCRQQLELLETYCIKRCCQRLILETYCVDHPLSTTYFGDLLCWSPVVNDLLWWSIVLIIRCQRLVLVIYCVDHPLSTTCYGDLLCWSPIVNDLFWWPIVLITVVTDLFWRPIVLITVVSDLIW